MRNHQFFSPQPSLTSMHDYWKNHGIYYTNLFGKVISLLFNTMSRFIIAFLPRSKRLLILWLQSLTAVILEPKKIKFLIVYPSFCHEVMRLDAMIFVFWMLSFKPAFSLSSFTVIKKLFSSSLSAMRLESRLPGEISITSDMQMTPSLWHKVKKN